MTPVISVRGLGKRYMLSHERNGYVALRDVITYTLFHPFRLLKTKKAERGERRRGAREDFWALRDVSFDTNKGEVIGIIGKNGAGKSTLLKILTGITPPTEGEARLTGKIASLLEVGTGFHPELSGRENIYLNGAILGMKRKEIAKKFDEIVAFAGIEQFLDTPVKYYSSGMYVRLAFSVAAHLEPEILIVDEVLAVGDAEFQKKCLGKMEEVTKQDGRTILFVSHNMAAVERLCKKTVLLEHGKIKMFGDTKEVVHAYLHGEVEKDDRTEWLRPVTSARAFLD
jgi:lipopolysaccharide transport system ATP-binding protein